MLGPMVCSRPPSHCFRTGFLNDPANIRKGPGQHAIIISKIYDVAISNMGKCKFPVVRHA